MMNSMQKAGFIFTGVFAFGLVILPANREANAQSNGGQSAVTDYKRCAACHTANGNGLPNAFPPLKANVVSLAKSDAGRAYLIKTLSNGLAGPLTVNGKRYSGVMPAQGWLSDDRAAALLNHVVTNIAGGSARAFTAEVAKVKAAGKVSPASVAKLRPQG